MNSKRAFPQSEAKILHVDMDAFFASVEQLDTPAYRGKPVIVGGGPKGRGVVATASYEARVFGIRSAMSLQEAKKRCSHGIFVPPRLDRYREISKKMHLLFQELTDLVEPLSLDEAFLDVSKNKFHEPSAYLLAVYLKSRIRAVLGLSASVGVSSVKFVAKIASSMQKPNGLVVVAPCQIDAFIKKLPVEKLWSVGPVTARKLNASGIFSVKDMRQRPIAFFKNCFGEKHGTFLYHMVWGRDDRKVQIPGPCQSKGVEETFEQDLKTIEACLSVLLEQSKKLASCLKKNHLYGRTLVLKVKFFDFQIRTRSKTVSVPFQTSTVMFQIASKLLRRLLQVEKKPVRLLGLCVKNFL